MVRRGLSWVARVALRTIRAPQPHPRAVGVFGRAPPLSSRRHDPCFCNGSSSQETRPWPERTSFCPYPLPVVPGRSVLPPWHIGTPCAGRRWRSALCDDGEAVRLGHPKTHAAPRLEPPAGRPASQWRIRGGISSSVRFPVMWEAPRRPGLLPDPWVPGRAGAAGGWCGGG